MRASCGSRGPGVEEDGRRVVRERLTQAEIAARIGGSREMVSRILSDLSAGGYIGVARSRSCPPQAAAHGENLGPSQDGCAASVMPRFSVLRTELPSLRKRMRSGPRGFPPAAREAIRRRPLRRGLPHEELAIGPMYTASLRCARLDLLRRERGIGRREITLRRRAGRTRQRAAADTRRRSCERAARRPEAFRWVFRVELLGHHAY